MSVEGDARATRQSSSLSARLSGLPARARAFGRLAFAGFVFAHVALQAFRATGDGARPEPGLETQPGFVAAVLLIVWLPFALFAVQQLRSLLGSARARAPEASPDARALAFAERLALLVVVAFALGHTAIVAWPLFSGSATAEDVRPALVLSLSSTSHGAPMHAAAYICGVAAASFYATRQVLAACRGVSRPLARVVVALGVLCYALGSFAVIRCSGGQIFP
ncbi:MAG: hypothetical protein ABI548_20365 [Polyangiaceae bacterium]